jgi:hypothetical protein
MVKPLLAITLASVLAVPVFGGRRRTVAVSRPAQEELKITFVNVTSSGSEAMIDAGAMSRTRGKVTKRVFGIRLDAANPSEGATATLRAFLESHDGRSTIRVDGIEIGSVPKLINAQTPLGIVTTHTLEIEVPATVPQGALASSLRWEASTN